MNLLNDARMYRDDLRWSLIPTVDKRPAVAAWKPFVDRHPTDDEVREWFARPDVTGVAIIAGPISGDLAVADFDQVPAYEAWKARHPAIAAALPTVRTARGLHVYCRSDQPRIIKLRHGEYRGAGYTLAPGSRHPSGMRYEWVNPLPKGRLPEIDHRIFLEGNEIDQEGVTETAERTETTEKQSMASAFSAISAISVTSIIEKTLPQKSGERNECLFRLARGLKFDAGLADAPMRELKVLVRQWHNRAQGVIATPSFDETWADFLHGWKRARHALAGNIIDRAAHRVADNPPPEMERFDSEPVRRLVALCAGLAAENRAGGKFFLSTHQAGGWLKVDPNQAWRWLNMLVAEGIIKRLERGDAHRAARYQWIGGGK